MTLLVIVALIFIYLIKSSVHSEKPFEPKLNVIINDTASDSSYNSIDAEDGNANLNPNDSENVHNSTVSRYMNIAIDRLKESAEFSTKKPDESIAEIYDAIYSGGGISLGLRTHAAIVLNEIIELNFYNENFDLFEKQLIDLVWKRINHPGNKSRKKSLIENLIKQLADCHCPYSLLICPHGRFARIIQSLEKADWDDIVTLIPMWIIKEEIGNYCNKYRSKMLDKISKDKYKHYQKALDDDIDDPENEDTAKKVKEINDYLRKVLNKKFHSNYIERGVLNREELDRLTQPYFDCLV